MQRDYDDERQPLLSRRDHNDDADHNVNRKSKGWSLRPWIDSLAAHMPVYRILIVTLLMFVSSQGPVSAAIDQTRVLACAEYYQHHPPQQDEAFVLGNSSHAQKLCDKDWIEGRSAQVLSIASVVGSLVTSAMIVFLEPRLNMWGRKRIFLFAIALLSVDRTTNMFLPVGYPYGPPAGQMPVSPVWVMRIWLVAGCISNMLGSEVVPQMCLRLMITEVSSAGSKTSGLLGLSQMSMLSITFAPALTSWIGSLLPISSGVMIHLLFGLGHQLARIGHLHKAATGDSPGQPTLPPTVPGGHGSDPAPLPPITNDGQYNVGPFFVSLVTIIVTFVVALALLPADRHADLDDENLSAPTASTPTKIGAVAKRESLFWRVWPRKDVDGKRDWRIAQVVVVSMAHMSCAYSINILLQFFGHEYHWGQESVALLVSSMGITRMITLFFITPLFNAFFEHTAKRPSALRHLPLEQLRTLSKSTPAVKAPAESEWEESPQEYQQDGYHLDADDDNDEQHVLHSAVATWRAYVDRGVLATSWGFDILGWLLVALFTMTNNEVMVLVSGLVVALGAASLPVRMGVDLVIVSDVLARTAEAPNRTIEAPSPPPPPPPQQQHQDTVASGHPHGSASMPSYEQHPLVQIQADELYFSLLGFFDSISFFVSPIVAAELYKRTLSTFPAANWIFPAMLYAVALTMHFSMTIHRKSPPSARS